MATLFVKLEKYILYAAQWWKNKQSFRPPTDRSPWTQIMSAKLTFSSSATGPHSIFPTKTIPRKTVRPVPGVIDHVWPVWTTVKAKCGQKWLHCWNDSSPDDRSFNHQPPSICSVRPLKSTLFRQAFGTCWCKRYIKETNSQAGCRLIYLQRIIYTRGWHRLQNSCQHSCCGTTNKTTILR